MPRISVTLTNSESGALERVAKDHKRSKDGEAATAIQIHIEAWRKELCNGSKLPKPKANNMRKGANI